MFGEVPMMYDGRVQRLYDAIDPEKGLTFGTDLDVDGQLYVAFEIGGKVVRKDAKYKRDGPWNRGEQPKDRTTHLYLSHYSVVALYDILGKILQGEVTPYEEHLEQYVTQDDSAVDDIIKRYS